MTSPSPRVCSRPSLAVLAAALLSAAAGCTTLRPTAVPDEVAGPPALDVIWVASDTAVAAAMLEAAHVGPGDIVYDLGCGDGVIAVMAASRYGARAVGVDLDPERIREARANAERAGVAERVTFLVQDLFATDVREATVVALYLSPQVNARLRPTLLRELAPGTRIVSHDFDMGDWLPERTVEVRLTERAHRVFLWRVPPPAPEGGGRR